MEARMKHPVFVVPEAMRSLQTLEGALRTAARRGGMDQNLLNLVYLRASQINGCSVCVDLHTRDATAAGESNQRLFAVAAWRDAPYFSDGERAALALTEAVTRLSDRPDPVPDEIWAEAARFYDEQALSSLILGIASINVWNRLNVSTRQVAGAWTP